MSGGLGASCFLHLVVSGQGTRAGKGRQARGGSRGLRVRSPRKRPQRGDLWPLQRKASATEPDGLAPARVRQSRWARDRGLPMASALRRVRACRAAERTQPGELGAQSSCPLAGAPRLQICIFPGNPGDDHPVSCPELRPPHAPAARPQHHRSPRAGNAGFYLHFMSTLFDLFDRRIDVLAVSHVGHDPEANSDKVLAYPTCPAQTQCTDPAQLPCTHPMQLPCTGPGPRAPLPHPARRPRRSGALTRRSNTRWRSSRSSCCCLGGRPSCCWRTASAPTWSCTRWRRSRRTAARWGPAYRP
jgi:hypothetical protein